MNSDNSKIELGIVFGGRSSEYEVSLLSATSVLENIDSEKYNIYKIGISKQGQSFLYTGEVANIGNDTWKENNCTPCVISPDHIHHGLIVFGEKSEIIKLDCVFPVLHGKNGEDGTIQGLLSLAGIPFVGCDTISSACCMDKAITKALLDGAKIKNAKWESVLDYQYAEKKDHYINKIEQNIGYPCFVKPANAGSSVGVTKAIDRASLEKAMLLAFENDRKALIEEAIIGREIECAILGNQNPIAAALGEIVPCNDFYDYDAKYLAGKTVTHIPARVEDLISNNIREIALKAYQVLGCEGFSRIDFFLTQSNEIILNEINTIPGFTAISMFPKLFEYSGIPYKTLIDRLILLALERK